MILHYIRLAIRYPDGYVKCQDWEESTVSRLQRLVFAGARTDSNTPAELRPRHDWRDTPCLLRYFVDATKPEPICQRGRPAPKKVSAPKRGVPIGIALNLEDAAGAPRQVVFDQLHLAETIELEFRLTDAGVTVLRHLRDRIDKVDIDDAPPPGHFPYVPPGPAGQQPSDPLCGFPHAVPKRQLC